MASGQCQSWQSRPPEGTGHTDPSDILQRLTSSGEQRIVSCIKIREEREKHRKVGIKHLYNTAVQGAEIHAEGRKSS